MNQNRYKNNYDDEDIEFRKYKLDEDSEFESRLQAKNIIKAFIQNENEAEEIKSRAQNKKPQYWKEQKDNKLQKNDGYNTKLDQDIEMALEIINKRKEITKKPVTDNVVLNMELRHAKIKQMKEDRIKQKQETEFTKFEQQKAARPPSANRQSQIRGSGSIQSSNQKGANNDWENSSNSSRPSARYVPQQQSLRKQSNQSQSSSQISQLYNDSSITDQSINTDQQNKKVNPKNEIQELKNKRQNLEQQSKKMEEDMKNLKENLRKELFQNVDASMIQNKNGQSNISETIDFLQKEADESRMKYNQFRLSKLVKAYNFVLKRYKRIYFNQVFDILKQKNREHLRHEQQCVNIMRLKKLFVVFSGWKKYMYSQKDEKDVKFYLQEKIHENTFLNRAYEYYKRRLIRICMRHWKKYWKISKQEKKLDEEKNGLKYKIKGFISNLKQNIQQSELETQNQKEQQKQRVIQQFLKLNGTQNKEEQEIYEEEENSQIYEQSQQNQKSQKQLAKNDVKNQIKGVQNSNLPQSSKQPIQKNAERNNLRSSITSQNSAQCDKQPIKDKSQYQEKSPKLNKYDSQNKMQSNQVTPQKRQSNQNNNNRSPISQSESPYPQNNIGNSNNKNQQQMMQSPQSQQSYSNSKSYERREFESQEDYDNQGYLYNNDDIEYQSQYYDPNYDDENNYDPNDLQEIARSKVPQPQQSQRPDQITFRQNKNQAKQQSSPNTQKDGRQDSKNHNQSMTSGKVNKEEREEKLKQIQQRTEDRKKKAEEFKKKHEELRKQKEEEKKKKELEELEKEREKRKEEYDNFQKKKREEKEKKEKAEKDKQELAEKLVLAKSHHQKQIIKYYGLRPWSKYMELQDHLIVVANQFNYMRLLKNGLLYLAEATKINKKLFQQEMDFKQNQAKDHYKLTILKKGFDLIRVFSKQSKEESDGYRQQRVDYLKRTVFYKWNDVLSVLRNENFAFEEQYRQIIVQFRKVVLQERAFRSWKVCSKEEKAERLKNNQKDQYRSKVNQWLNEFKSPQSEEDINQEQNSELSEQLKNSNFDDINKSQVKNEALKKYYNKKNQLNKDQENREKKISEQPQNKEDSEDEENSNKQEDEEQNENKIEDYEQESDNKDKHNDNNGQEAQSDDESNKDQQPQQPNDEKSKANNKNYDLPLIQVLQNTNELEQKLAKNNSRSSKDFNQE